MFGKTQSACYSNNTEKMADFGHRANWHTPCNAIGIPPITVVHQFKAQGANAMFKFETAGRTVAAIACTALFSSVFFMGAVGPAIGHIAAGTIA
jgi:hypothetical protein